jgi:threonine aldolase
MRRAMAAAEVGDEQRGADPTTNALQDRVAELLGHEAGLFLPSGTMCNAIAVRLQIGPAGEAMLVDRTAHPVIAEAGGPGSISGATLILLEGAGGVFTAEQLMGALPARGDRYSPRARLVGVEQTTNLGGGRVWPPETVEAVLGVARREGLATHLDGARLLNAVAASGVAADRWAAGFDTAWIDFSKGLGAPAGAVLCASRALIEEAWRYKQMWGGALRQSGVLAAAALWALDHHVDRLAEDHANARRLAEGLAEIDGVSLDPAAVETNIVLFDVDDAPGLRARLLEAGVELSAFGPHRMRAVTHLDVDAAGIDRALAAVGDALA